MKKITLVAALFLPVGGILFAEPAAHSEYEIKAAFLYNFAKFVEWPPEAAQKHPGNLVIAILGSDPFGNDLDNELEGKTIQDRKIILKRVANLDKASDFDVLFISASKEHEVEEILDAVKKLPVLTVSDMDDFIQRGGVVGFTLEGRKVRFGINVKAADQAGLKVSSQLLKLAKRVISRRLQKIFYVWLPFATIQSARS